MAITPAKLPRNADEVVNKKNFFDRVVPLYEQGVADIELEADVESARATIPAATGGTRDFSFIAPEIPEFIPFQHRNQTRFFPFTDHSFISLKVFQFHFSYKSIFAFHL